MKKLKGSYRSEVPYPLPEHNNKVNLITKAIRQGGQVGNS